MLRNRYIGTLLIAICIAVSSCSWQEWVSVTQGPAVTFHRTNTNDGCGTFDTKAFRAIYAVSGCDGFPSAYVQAHEEAHGIAINIGLAYGDGLIGQEKAADVLAYIRTGYVGPYWPNGIPDEAIAVAYNLLAASGIDP